MQSALQSNAALSILSAYYPVVSTLHTYLRNILDTQELLLLQDTDGTPYNTFLCDSYVAAHVSPANLRRFVPVAPMCHMQDVIDLAQESLFRNARGGRPSNIITAGYRRVSQLDARSKIGARRVPLTNYFINTVVTALQAPEWETLLQRVGEDVVFHLLTETSVFVSLPNGCLCQMTGDPVLHMKPPIIGVGHPGGDGERRETRGTKRRCIKGYSAERPSKRQKNAHNTGTTEKPSLVRTTGLNEITPADVAFLRAKMLYSHPCFVPHSAKIIIGLPPKHILNSFYPAWHSTSNSCEADPDPKQQMGRAKHLAKYVFPRQYGLRNPFCAGRLGKYDSLRTSDYADRELEIKNKGTCKTPKRLKHVLDMLEKLIWSHHKCKYKMLLDMACPSKLARDKSQPLDSNVILELMSETSIQLQTQPAIADTSISVSLDSSGGPVIPYFPSQTQRKHTRHKPRFAEFACGANEVFRYAVLVTRAVVPQTFWGSNYNFNVVMRHCKQMISMRRYETMTVHNVLQHFRTADCDWLAPHTTGALQQLRVSVTDALKRRELLEEFLFWYFDGFLMSLLKTTFYVTESAAFRNKLLYFRHDDWHTLCLPLVAKLSTDTFCRIDQREAQEILRQRKLGFSFVRLLPKETGVRPIVNLRRRAEKDPFRPSQSINQILQAAFQILTYEKDHRPGSLGASVFGPNEVYAKLTAFKTKLVGDSSKARKLPKLYFVKVDVQACFDTIEQTRLLQILRDLLSEDTYMIQRYGTVNKVGEKFQRKYIKKAMPEDDHPHFLTYAAQLAGALRNTVFVDQVVYSYARKQDIISLLEEHITENLVKIGNEYYRQMIGIPQGSVLSAILCSFFYGDLERKVYKFSEDPECCFMRLIDDWLLVTTNLSKANRFYNMVSKGHPEYGCFISKEKSLVNFDHPELVNIVDPRSRVFPWCGYSINMSDLSVTVDYGRYHTTYLQDSLTVEYGRRPGAAFAHKMMQLAKSKSHIIYNDANLNSRDAIYVNIYQNFAVLAMKMHHYLRQWGLDVSKSRAFILGVIRQAIHFSYTAVCVKAGHKLATQHGARVIAQKSEVTWLGTHAFHTVFSRKPQSYAGLLKSLQFDLSLPRYRRFKRQFKKVTTEGVSTLTLLCF